MAEAADKLKKAATWVPVSRFLYATQSCKLLHWYLFRKGNKLLAHCAEVRTRCRYVYTAEDVAKMVEDKRAAGNVRNLAKEKSRLVVRRAKALEDNDTEEVER